MNRTEALLIGFVMGLALPKGLIHEWRLLMQQRLWTWVQARRAWLMLAGIVVGLALICSAFILGGIALSIAKSNADCVRDYVSGSAPLAAERDRAIQVLWDDFKQAQTATTPKEQAQLRQLFFDDLDKERAANQALQDYRDAHAPKADCS